jgi:hypothetical protein
VAFTVSLKKNVVRGELISVMVLQQIGITCPRGVILVPLLVEAAEQAHAQVTHYFPF